MNHAVRLTLQGKGQLQPIDGVAESVAHRDLAYLQLAMSARLPRTRLQGRRKVQRNGRGAVGVFVAGVLRSPNIEVTLHSRLPAVPFCLCFKSRRGDRR